MACKAISAPFTKNRWLVCGWGVPPLHGVQGTQHCLCDTLHCHLCYWKMWAGCAWDCYHSTQVPTVTVCGPVRCTVFPAPVGRAAQSGGARRAKCASRWRTSSASARSQAASRCRSARSTGGVAPRPLPGAAGRPVSTAPHPRALVLGDGRASRAEREAGRYSSRARPLRKERASPAVREAGQPLSRARHPRAPTQRNRRGRAGLAERVVGQVLR